MRFITVTLLIFIVSYEVKSVSASTIDSFQVFSPGERNPPADKPNYKIKITWMDVHLDDFSSNPDEIVTFQLFSFGFPLLFPLKPLSDPNIELTKGDILGKTIGGMYIDTVEFMEHKDVDAFSYLDRRAVIEVKFNLGAAPEVLTATEIPLPAAFPLMAAGLGVFGMIGLVARRRRRTMAVGGVA